MVRSSSNKKNKSDRKTSKYSQMRHKLTLKHSMSPVQFQIKQEVNVAEASTAIPNVKEVLGADNEQYQDNMTKTKKLFQRASPMRLVRIYPSIREDQQLLIRNNDYGGLLDIKCSKLHSGLCQFLMESFDPMSCMLVFPRRGAIPVTEESVQQVFEIIDSPRQNNGYDCGFFTLKNLEACPSRTPATYSQKDMPNIRKLYTDKWLRFTKKANW